MTRFLAFALFALCLLSPIAFAEVNVTMYYGQGCPHCASTSALLNGELKQKYGLNIVEKEVYQNDANRRELFAVYQKFGVDPMTAGVPTTVVNEYSIVIGALSPEQWDTLLGACSKRCVVGIFRSNEFNLEPEPGNGTGTGTGTSGGQSGQGELPTLAVLIGAAIVDSINPCTIAVMVMLLGAIVVTKGKNQALLAGLIFSFTVFVMYLLMGLGIFTLIASSNLTGIFYGITTIGALAIAILEINAYFNYKPGMAAVEMPMFLRPHARRVTSGAASLFGVFVAAVFCSLFLLPCSSGPYLMVLAMLSKAKTAQTLGYLALYNFVFILPMLVITLLVYFGEKKVEEMGAMKDRYVREIHLVSGIIMLLLFLLMLNELIRFI
ncbi:MAG: hypothetical protein NT157_02650 [Candidatus Micrarchaeota archaeon]|nr:hypothetical protein [Candidatus Micrarchaeota archaeon]